MIFLWSSSNAKCSAAVSLPIKVVLILVIAVRTEVVLEVTGAKCGTLTIMSDLHIVQRNIACVRVATNTFEYQLKEENKLLL